MTSLLPPDLEKSACAHLRTHTLGYPRIGQRRQLKKAVESYWKGELNEAGLQAMARDLRRRHWETQREAGIDLPASNDFSLYDQVLDMSCLVGNVPARFPQGGAEVVPLSTYFAIARGSRTATQECAHCASSGGEGIVASEMTKWFDTNYHYIVPEFNESTEFRLAGSKPFHEYAEAKALGIETKPVLLGPITYLYLGKVRDSKKPVFDRFSLLEKLLPVYREILSRLREQGVEWVQLDEPIFALDAHAVPMNAVIEAYDALASAAAGLNLMVASYFGSLGQNLLSYARLPVQGLHLDLVRGSTEEVRSVIEIARKTTVISLGVVDGRNIWRTRYEAILPTIQQALGQASAERIWLAPSCSLLHVPHALTGETTLDPELKSWLAFAKEKLEEVRELAGLSLDADRDRAPGWIANQELHRRRAAHPSRLIASVREHLASFPVGHSHRSSPFSVRQGVQRSALQLPLYPTTTIGSFPQTSEVRALRARWRSGELSSAAYTARLEEETLRCVREQEAAGLDVLVHGEFERTDMVEYFGELLEGFAFTTQGWVQSYGSRCVKPPIIFGDITRPKPMTVDWFRKAQDYTEKPMKGMLTGPVTILNWSFVRDDLSRADVCRQIALALRAEVKDLEAAGCRVIQIDEPALREGLPLRQEERELYLTWSVDAFRLAASAVRDDTQIHTHMCYCDFDDILQAIADLDADVITLETARSAMTLLKSFGAFRYPNEIGPGVYDIHSPRVPGEPEMLALMEEASSVLPRQNLWVNPDCGLKTRGWEEVRTSLTNMVKAAQTLRDKYANVSI